MKNKQSTHHNRKDSTMKNRTRIAARSLCLGLTAGVP